MRVPTVCSHRSQIVHCVQSSLRPGLPRFGMVSLLITWCYQAYYYEAIIARIVGMLIGEVTDSNLMRTKPSIISRANLDPVQTG